MNIDLCNLCNLEYNIKKKPTLRSDSSLYIKFLYFFNLYDKELNIKNNIEETQIIQPIFIER